MTKQTIAVEHVRIESGKAFADVRAALERIVPHLDPSLVKALNEGDPARVARARGLRVRPAIDNVRSIRRRASDRCRAWARRGAHARVDQGGRMTSRFAGAGRVAL